MFSNGLLLHWLDLTRLLLRRFARCGLLSAALPQNRTLDHSARSNLWEVHGRLLCTTAFYGQRVCFKSDNGAVIAHERFFGVWR